MANETTRRRLLASVGGVAGVALGGTAGAAPVRASPSASADELPVRWNRTYAPNRINGAVGALEHDGQYVALGTTGEEGTETTGWLFAVDGTSGAGQWQTSVENTDVDAQPQFQQLVEAPDGDGFALLGARLNEGVASLVRTGPNGEAVWWEEYEVETDGEASGTFLSSSLVPTDDGYFVGGARLAGSSVSAVVLDVAVDGTERSRTRLFGNERSNLLDATPDGEGGLVGVGQLQTRSTSASDRPRVRAVAVGLDAGLSVAWTREFTASRDGAPFQTNLPQAVTGTAEGYAVAGSVAPEGGESSRGWVLLLDGDGTERTSRLFAPQPVTSLTGVVEASDGLTVVGQLAESVTSTSTTGWVAELDDGAQGRWSKSFDAAAVNNPVDVFATSDDGVALVGTTQAGSRDADPRSRGWLVKLGGDPAPSVTDSEGTDTPEPTPTPTTEQTSTDAPGSTPAPTTTPARMATDTPDDDTTTGSGPGFGVVGTLTALGAGALYRRLVDDGE
ncbi:MAG: PGF-CTERM sorting domain-containing protein [Haloarculaceae archaeon]